MPLQNKGLLKIIEHVCSYKMYLMLICYVGSYQCVNFHQDYVWSQKKVFTLRSERETRRFLCPHSPQGVRVGTFALN